MSITDRAEYTAANRLSWNEAADIHRRQTFEKLLAGFRRAGYSCLDEIATANLERIGVKGKDCVQVCCNNGRELISLKNMGARRCVGFDISDKFIAQAQELNAAAGLDVNFERCDVYDIPAAYDASFDLALITIGALGWLPELGPFFERLVRLLRPGGALFMYETHPMLDMFEPADKDDQPVLRYSYFRSEPFADETGIDYYGHSEYASPVSYWFHHKLSDIIGAMLTHGLHLDSFVEYGHDISETFAHIDALENKPPMCYTLSARKGK